MIVELDRALFRRFVQLYLITLSLVLPIVFYRLLTPSWTEFVAEFLDLLSRRFGWNDDDLAYWLPIGSLIIAHLACTIGLLLTRRWARLGFVASIFTLFLFDAVFGPPAIYETGATQFLNLVLSMTAGAIILTAYARGAGAVWFGDEQATKE